MIRAEAISYLWHDPVKRQLVEEASQRCPDLGKDIEIIKGWSEFNPEPGEQDRKGQPMISAGIKLHERRGQTWQVPGKSLLGRHGWPHSLVNMCTTNTHLVVTQWQLWK